MFIKNPVILERKREKSIRQGDIEIDAKLDLHGMTQAEAFAALGAFMHKAVKAGKRHLLIITGKGRGGTGVLRNNLNHWLDRIEQANAILALRPASLKHGGDGAFYVIMRKKIDGC
jgi:DNA-nicking Smr family endonuclease